MNNSMLYSSMPRPTSIGPTPIGLFDNTVSGDFRYHLIQKSFGLKQISPSMTFQRPQIANFLACNKL